MLSESDASVTREYKPFEMNGPEGIQTGAARWHAMFTALSVAGSDPDCNRPGVHDALWGCTGCTARTSHRSRRTDIRLLVADEPEIRSAYLLFPLSQLRWLHKPPASMLFMKSPALGLPF